MDIINHYEIKVEYKDGFKMTNYYKNGVLHRDDDLPATILVCGSIVSYGWFQEGESHRDNDKPAFLMFGYCEETGIILREAQWKQNGKLHRNKLLPAYYGYNDHKELTEYSWFMKGDNNHRLNSIEGVRLPTKIILHKPALCEGYSYIEYENGVQQNLDSHQILKYIPKSIFTNNYDPFVELKDEFVDHYDNSDF